MQVTTSNNRVIETLCSSVDMQNNKRNTIKNIISEATKQKAKLTHTDRLNIADVSIRYKELIGKNVYESFFQDYRNVITNSCSGPAKRLAESNMFNTIINSMARMVTEVDFTVLSNLYYKLPTLRSYTDQQCNELLQKILPIVRPLTGSVWGVTN